MSQPYRALLPFPYNEIHFPVAETLAVGLRRSVMYAYPVWDITHLGLLPDFGMVSVFQFMAAMLAEFSAFITPYPFVYRLMGYVP